MNECPKCNHYNAMLSHGLDDSGENLITRCRDCGFEVLVSWPPAAPLTSANPPAGEEQPEREPAFYEPCSECHAAGDEEHDADCSNADEYDGPTKCPDCYAKFDAGVDAGVVCPGCKRGIVVRDEEEKATDPTALGPATFGRIVKMAEEMANSARTFPLETSGDQGGPCPACGGTTEFDQSLGNFRCTEGEDCGGFKMPKSRIERLILDDGLILTDVIDVVCALNGFVGVGYITFGDQIGEYIKAKASGGLSKEAWLNS